MINKYENIITLNSYCATSKLPEDGPSERLNDHRSRCFSLLYYPHVQQSLLQIPLQLHRSSGHGITPHPSYWCAGGGVNIQQSSRRVALRYLIKLRNCTQLIPVGTLATIISGILKL